MTLKSIHNISLGNESDEMFTPEILAFIGNEGFTLRTNDSYNKDLKGGNVFWCRGGNSGSNILGIYIGTNGIAIDSDYDCGGNSSTYFFEFSESADSVAEKFEKAYNAMVAQLNALRSY
jgi:hypothetical protein